MWFHGGPDLFSLPLGGESTVTDLGGEHAERHVLAELAVERETRPTSGCRRCRKSHCPGRCSPSGPNGCGARCPESRNRPPSGWCPRRRDRRYWRPTTAFAFAALSISSYYITQLPDYLLRLRLNQSISHMAQILPLSVVAVKRGLVNASRPLPLSFCVVIVTVTVVHR